ncbi:MULTISPECIES: site-2 protease family protein [Aerosakkonema]|uniref:site-2 protease family protein n=1 Tax=Aerosakkonema TaxID=1246629 RepID=UPI0035BA454D
MQYLIYGLAIYGLLVGAGYFLIFQRLLNVTLQYSKITIDRDNKTPDYVKELFKMPVNEIKKLGFQFCCYCQEETIFAEKRWQVLLFNKNCQTFAHAVMSALPDRGNQANISFYTYFEDGVVLLTMNGLVHSIIGEMPATIIQDPYAVTTEEQWQAHQEKLDELTSDKEPRNLSLEAFVEFIDSHQAAYINHLLVSKQITRQKGQDLFDITVLTALKTAIKIKRGTSKYTKLLKQRAARAKMSPLENVEIPVEVEVEAFCILDKWEQRRAKKNFKFWFLIVSLVLFVLSFTAFFQAETLLILIAVLFLHELGHWLAMKLYGYENTSIFFLPFFGAAATGRKDNATLSEKVIVLLAGPLPGLLLGAGIGITMQANGNIHDSKVLFMAISLLVVINYLNLLPIMPLDGGRILNILLFSRHPYTDVLFKIITVSIFIFAGFGLGEAPLLPVGFLVAITIPSSFRSAKVLQKLQQMRLHQNEDAENLLASIFHTIKKSGYGSLNFAQKYRLAKDISQRHQESYASLTTRLSLLALYLLSLVAGLVLVVLTFVPLRYLSIIFMNLVR